MAGLHFGFTGDNSSFMRTVREVTAGVNDATRQIELNGGNIDRVISTIKTGVATLGIGLGFKELSGQIFQTRAQFEQLEIAFTTMLGSADKANSLLSQLKQTAAKTPFEMEDVVGGAKSLLAYGIEAEKVNDTLVRLGDIASGLSIPLNDLTYLYGTTMVQGRMFTQDFRQFQGRGIPIADELAKVLGIAKDKVGEAVTAGKVGAKELEAAIQSMTDEGGRFGGLMAKQSDSLKGKWENIKDTIGLMFNEMGHQTEGVWNLTLDATASIVDHWQEVIAVLGGVAAAYGAQKAYLMLDSAFTAAKTDFGYTAEIEQLQALIPAKEKAAKSDLEQAVASGQLTEAKAAQITALREEAKAQLETLTAKEAAAKAEAIAAEEKALNAQKEVDAIDEEIEAAWDKATAIMESMTAEEAETSITEINTLETMRNEAADIAQVASEEAKMAATNAAAASEARETLATQINTAETDSNSAATGILTIAKEKLAIAAAKVNAVLKANQFAIVAGAVVALGYAIYELWNYQTDYQKSLEKVSIATNEARVAGDKEVKTLEELKAKLDVAQKGSEEWKSTKDAIVKQFGQYIPQLDEEITKVGNLSTAYRDLVVAIQQANAAKGLKKFIDENDNSEEVTTKFRESLDIFRKSTKISKTGKAMLEPILRDFAINSSADSDIFKYVEDQLKIKYGVDQGKYIYDTYEYLLKRSDLKGFTEAHKMNQSYEREIEKYRKDMGISEADYNKVRYGIEAPEEKTETQDKSYWETKKKEAVSRLEALTDIAAKGKEGDKIRQEIAEYNKRLSSFDDGSKKKSYGPTAAQIDSKETDAHQKLIDLMKQQTEERLKLQQDYEYQQWQNRIDLMDEGEAKVIAQMELDHKKEQTSLDEQKNQAIKDEIARQKAIFDAQEDEKAVGNKKYAKQVFDPNSEEVQSATKDIAEQYATLENELTQKHEKAVQDRVKANIAAMDEYLSEYGTYQQKQLAIKQLYAGKIKAANNEAERLTLAKERDNKLSEINVNNMLMDIDWSLMFKGVGNVLSDLAKETLDKIEAYMKTPEFKKLDAANKEAYTNARNKLREEVHLTGSSPFNAETWGKVSEYTKKYQESVKALRDANQQHTQAVSNLEKANDNLIKAQNKLANATTDAEKAIAQKDVEIAQNGVNVAQTGVNITAQNVTQAQDNASEAQDNLANSANDATAGLDNFQKILGQMTDGSLLGFANGISNLILTIRGGSNGVGQGLEGLGAALGGAGSKILGIVGAILSILDMLADDPEQRIHEITEKLYTAINKLIKQAFTLVLSSIVDSVRLISNIGDGILKAFGINVNWNSSNSKKVAETTERLTERNERLQVSIDKLKESIDKSYGSQSIKDYQEARNAQQEYNENLRNILDAQQRYHSAHHSNAANWNISDESTALVNSLLGTNLRGDNWDDWSQLTAEQMDKIRTYLPQVWQEMLDSGDYDKSDYFNNYADQAGKLDELTKQIYENLTGISFEGLRDNFVSTLMDMGKSAEDFSDDLTKILQESLLRANISDKFEKRIQEWYNSIAESMMDENGNYRELTEDEINSYRQQWDEMVAEMIEERDRIAEITGYGIDAIQEKLTDISFDSVRDNFKSLLSDMETTTEDFTDNFTDMLRNALIEGLMNSKYDALLKDWYAAFAEAMDDQKLTDEERERLRQQYDAIVQQGITDRNAINDIVGGGAYSQQASSGEAWGMTQETGEELNGRFTALVELQATNNALVGQGNSLAIGILATLQSIAAASNTVTGSGDNETLLSIRDMLFLTTGHLEDIAKYTKRLQTMSDDMTKIKEAIEKI